MKNTERGVWGTQRVELVHTHAMQRQSLPASLTSCFAVSRPKFHPPSAAPLLANDIGLFPEKVVPEGTVRRDGSKRGAAGGEGPYVDSLQTTRVRVRWLTLNSWCLWYSNRLAAAPTVRATNRASRQQRTRRGKRHSEPGFLVFWFGFIGRIVLHTGSCFCLLQHAPTTAQHFFLKSTTCACSLSLLRRQVGRGLLLL